MLHYSSNDQGIWGICIITASSTFDSFDLRPKIDEQLIAENKT